MEKKDRMVDCYTELMVASYFIPDQTLTEHKETRGDKNEKKIPLYPPNIYSPGSEESQPVGIQSLPS